jgi:UDP:flavonoid glycosyltransferase YjiC (YdhE family)
MKIKKTTLKYDVLAILSGPEPQRSLLEKKLIEQLAVLPVKSAIVQGKIDKKTNIKNYGNIDIYNYVNASALEYLINSSDKIIARSGYTSIMDLISMQKPVLWIPTPGQDEQKYLARHIHQKFGYQYTTQAKISLDIDLLDNLPATNFSLFSKKPVKLI